MRSKQPALWSAGAAVWTFIAWGNRIGLLTGDERNDPWTWIRVGGSLILGVLLTIVAVLLWRGGEPAGWMRVVFAVFLVLMLVIWTRSAISVLSGDESVSFKVVHVVLAVISVGFGALLVRTGTRHTTNT